MPGWLAPGNLCGIRARWLQHTLSPRFLTVPHYWASPLQPLRLSQHSRLDHSKTFNPGSDHAIPNCHDADEISSSIDLPPLPGQRQPDDKDVFVDDFTATLEAHRARNRKPPIRNVEVDDLSLDVQFKRPFLPHIYQEIEAQGSEGHEQTVNHVLADPWKLPTDPFPAEPWNLPIDKPVPGSRRRFKMRQSVILEESGASGFPSKAHSRVFRFGDYEGIARMPLGDWELDQASAPQGSLATNPWLTHLDDCSGNHNHRLTQEIEAFEDYMRPNAEEEGAVQNLIAEVKGLFENILPSNELIIHGSRATGCARALSDIDFSVSVQGFEDPDVRGPSATRPKARREAVRTLKDITQALVSSPRFTAVEFIWAQIPLVEAQDRYTGLQIQFQTLAPVIPAREFAAYYIAELPSLRPLFLVLRHALHIRGLTNVMQGGIGSYPLLVMIVNALKQHDGLFFHKDLGVQLLYVLRFYIEADLYNDGYSADPPRVFPKLVQNTLSAREARASDPLLKSAEMLAQAGTDQPWLLCLQDPANPDNDLGRKSFAIKHIQATFQAFKAGIETRMTRWEDQTEVQRREDQGGLLSPMLEANYGYFDQQREALRNENVEFLGCSVRKVTNAEKAVDASLSVAKPKQEYFKQLQEAGPDNVRRAEIKRLHEQGKVYHFTRGHGGAAPLRIRRCASDYNGS